MSGPPDVGEQTMRLAELSLPALSIAVDRLGLMAAMTRVRTPRCTLHSDFLPAQLSGTIHAPGGTRARALAAALNGRIVAVGQSFTLAGDHVERFSIMLPEAAFREGRNTVELLSVTGDAGTLRLASIAHTG